MKWKIQTWSLKSSRCALFCQQVRKNSSQELAPRSPSQSLAAPEDKEDTVSQIPELLLIKVKEVYLSVSRQVWCKKFYLLLVRIETVSISLLNWILQHFIVTLLKWPFSARAAELSPLIDGKTYFSWVFKNVLKSCLGMIYSTDWTKYISILMHKSYNK